MGYAVHTHFFFSKLLLYVNSCLICVYFYSSWGVLAEHLRKLIHNQEVH